MALSLIGDTGQAVQLLAGAPGAGAAGGTFQTVAETLLRWAAGPGLGLVPPAEQAEALRALGYRFGQGYLYARPMPPEEYAARWLTGAPEPAAARRPAPQPADRRLGPVRSLTPGRRPDRGAGTTSGRVPAPS